MKLYRKADGEIVGTQALAGKGYTAIDVPVDKQGLIAWLNDNLPQELERGFNRGIERMAPAEAPTDEYLGADLDEGGAATPLTQAKVDEMFEPGAQRPLLERDEVCMAVSHYDGADLGYVALEVAARFKALSDRQDMLS